MTPLEQLAGSVEIGERVYVDPGHPDAPWKTGGRAGIIQEVIGDHARVVFHQAAGGQVRDVPLTVLRRERRIACRAN